MAEEFELVDELTPFVDPVTYYLKQDFIQTASGNKLSRRSVLCGSQNIQLSGRSVVKPGVILRGDLSLLRIGKNVIVGDGTVLRPPYKTYKGSYSYFPLSIGDFVTIGANAVISAASIGSFVDIGDDCVISKRCTIKDNAKILPGSMLPPDTVVPPFAVFGGSPATYLGEQLESAQFLQKERATTQYRCFQVATKTALMTSVEHLRNVTSFKEEEDGPTIPVLIHAIDQAKAAGATQADLVKAEQILKLLREF